jgi:hypothetical protein
LYQKRRRRRRRRRRKDYLEGFTYIFESAVKLSVMLFLFLLVWVIWMHGVIPKHLWLRRSALFPTEPLIHHVVHEQTPGHKCFQKQIIITEKKKGE